jgi:hypothetical protein
MELSSPSLRTMVAVSRLLLLDCFGTSAVTSGKGAAVASLVALTLVALTAGAVTGADLVASASMRRLISRSLRFCEHEGVSGHAERRERGGKDNELQQCREQHKARKRIKPGA